jgi:hypothetical protein
MARKPTDGSGRQAKGSPATLVLVEQSEAVTEALRPLDRIAVEMEGKWGVGRLQRLVTPEIAARFGSAKDKLNDAIRANDGDEVAKRASVLIRGWQALDAAATEANCEALPLRTVAVQHNGRAYVVAWDRSDVHKAAKLSRAPENVLTVHELLIAYEALKSKIDGVKQAFPGAELTKISIPPGGDALPF